MNKKIGRIAAATAISATVLGGVGLASAPQAAASTGDRCHINYSNPTLQFGDTGSAVRQLQCLLNVNGYGVVIDGGFGNDTRTKVRSFQSAHHLAVDGVVGTKTWSALYLKN